MYRVKKINVTHADTDTTVFKTTIPWTLHQIDKICGSRGAQIKIRKFNYVNIPENSEQHQLASPYELSPWHTFSNTFWHVQNETNNQTVQEKYMQFQLH